MSFGSRVTGPLTGRGTLCLCLAAAIPWLPVVLPLTACLCLVFLRGGSFIALLLGLGSGWYLNHETSKQIWDANYRLSDKLHRATTGQPLVSTQRQTRLHRCRRLPPPQSFTDSLHPPTLRSQPPIDVRSTIASPPARDVLPLETVDADRFMSAPTHSAHHTPATINCSLSLLLSLRGVVLYARMTVGRRRMTRSCDGTRRCGVCTHSSANNCSMHRSYRRRSQPQQIGVAHETRTSEPIYSLQLPYSVSHASVCPRSHLLMPLT